MSKESNDRLSDQEAKMLIESIEAVERDEANQTVASPKNTPTREQSAADPAVDDAA